MTFQRVGGMLAMLFCALHAAGALAEQAPGCTKGDLGCLAGGKGTSSSGIAFSVLKDFSPPDGEKPSAELLEASDGYLYGTTAGDLASDGTVFRITRDGVFSTLHTFTGADGRLPLGALIQGNDGALYGTTAGGGDSGHGTVYRLALSGTLTTLHSFAGGAGGETPAAGLALGTDGNFYGTTQRGGTDALGTVFRLKPAGELTIVHSFTGAGDGQFPSSELILVGAGAFFGTARGFSEAGGTFTCGTVFRITTAGLFATAHDFDDGSSLGCNPNGLTLSDDGTLFGTTSTTVFQITQGGLLTEYAVDGSPAARLVLADDGNFYGTTRAGGSNFGGSVFQVTPLGDLTTLSDMEGTDSSALVQGIDGNLYGVTSEGGVAGNGTVYQVTLGGALTTLHHFPGQPNGNAPRGTLVQAADGSFYGTTQQGAGYGRGGVFRLGPDGDLSNLHSFAPGEAYQSFSRLSQGTDGDLFGTSLFGGASDLGVVFRVTPAGAYSTLHSFDGTDGSRPRGALVQGSDDRLYGITSSGGSFGGGTVFGITPAGTLETLHEFSFGADGGLPRAGLAFGPDGAMYGTTSAGGANDLGTVFKITTDGTLTTLYDFGDTEGGFPRGELLLASDGNFYGTNSGTVDFNTGLLAGGSVFRITPAGTYTKLYSFTGGGDGDNPTGALVQGRDGNFYGVTAIGGNDFITSFGQIGYGTVYRITPDGALTTLYTFGGAGDGGFPLDGLILARDGDLYGVTIYGTIFRVAPKDNSSSADGGGGVLAAHSLLTLVLLHAMRRRRR